MKNFEDTNIATRESQLKEIGLLTILIERNPGYDTSYINKIKDSRNRLMDSYLKFHEPPNPQ